MEHGVAWLLDCSRRIPKHGSKKAVEGRVLWPKREHKIENHLPISSLINPSLLLQFLVLVTSIMTLTSAGQNLAPSGTCVACLGAKAICGVPSFDEGDHHEPNCSWCPFPPASAFPSCDHPLRVCLPCFRHHIEVQMETVGPEHLSCPECPNPLQHDQIRHLASKEVFERYETSPRSVSTISC